MKTFKTENSTYIVDAVEMVYMRLPRDNRCRSLAEIEKQEASWRLKDGEWIEFGNIGLRMAA